MKRCIACKGIQRHRPICLVAWGPLAFVVVFVLVDIPLAVSDNLLPVAKQ